MVSHEDGHSVGIRRLAVLAFIGMLLVSAVGGMLVGSSGIAAAQQGGSSGNNTTARNATAGNSTASSGIGNNSTVANPVNATIQAFKRGDFGYKKLSSGEKKKIRNTLKKLARGNSSFNKNGKQIGKIKDILLYDREVFDIPMDTKPEKSKQIEEIIKKQLGAEGLRGYGTPQTEPFNFTGFNIPSLIETKLKAIGHTLMQGAGDILSNVYKKAFSTPVPQNTGWQGIFGTPVDTKKNQTFHNLYQNLLVEKLYPLTNLLLGIGIIFMGLSLTVNPLISCFRVWDLMIKFATFILLYGFSWVAVTLIHGAVNDITMWIAPSAEAVGGLVTNVSKMSGISIGAYFVGSSGIMATAFSMAIELQMRLVLLKYFFPYIFAPLILVLYVSPWQRLRTAASTALWQYVNVLVVIIPMALFLKAATLVKVGNSLGETLHAMIVLCALFAAAVSIPIGTTWFFFKVPGKAAASVKSAGKSAAKRGGKYAGGKTWSGATSVGGAAKSGGSRVGGAVKDRMGWGGDSESAMDEPDPSDRAEEQVEATVEASDEADLSLSDSGSLDGSTVESMPEDGYTTAGLVRELDEEQNSDTTPMNHEEMVESYYEESSHQTTLDQQVAD
jgi:hypothetical protein